MAAATRADGREWVAKVAHYVREHRLDTLIDSYHRCVSLRTLCGPIWSPGIESR
jgi:hypothetical protein